MRLRGERGCAALIISQHCISPEPPLHHPSWADHFHVRQPEITASFFTMSYFSTTSVEHCATENGLHWHNRQFFNSLKEHLAAFFLNFSPQVWPVNASDGSLLPILSASEERDPRRSSPSHFRCLGYNHCHSHQARQNRWEASLLFRPGEQPRGCRITKTKS